MTGETGEGIGRRDLVKATLAAVGTTAVLAGTMEAARAQAQAPVADPAGGTVFTGDVILGKRVVRSLDIRDLEPGRKHLLYFEGVSMAGGQRWYVSVIVAKGVRPGKRITLTSGVHGDEISSIHTVQTVMGRLDPAQMAGSVMAVLDVARPAVESLQRRWPDYGRGVGLIDLNREWPGHENGASAASRHAGLVFNRLLRPNTDLAIDFHTGTTGLAAAALNIGDRTIPDVKTMMDLFPVGLIWDDGLYPGVLHNAFVDVGIPCFTPEIGAARVLDLAMSAQFVEGTLNVLKHYGVVPGPLGRTAADVSAFVGDGALPVLSTQAGFVEFQVKLDAAVRAGQTLAIQRNAFGEVVADYTSAVDGRLAAVRTDAITDPGNVLAFVVFKRSAASAQPARRASDAQRDYPE